MAKKWAVVPSYDIAGTPAYEGIVSDGIRVGYNTADRDAWAVASNDVPFCKCAYFLLGQYYSVLFAVQIETYESSFRMYTARHSSSSDRVSGTSFSSGISYGDYLYIDSTTFTQVIDVKRNPDIPAYSTLDEAKEALNDGIWYVVPDDPYAPGGETGEGGGTGTFDDTTEPIPTPDIPATSVIQTGFISLYSPDITQLRNLASYMWSDTGLDLDTFKRIFTDPMESILGLSLVPLQPSLGASENVVLGNVTTGVYMPRLSSQYIKYSCGSLTIEEYWGGYLDYSPYTRAEIYLPFIGAKPLNIDDIMGKTLTLTYLIDVLSGGCVACLESGGSVLYQFIGQCACSVPITGRDLTNVINGLLSVAGAGAGVMMATGGLGLAGLAVTGSLASNVMGMKPHVEKSGSMGGMGGMLGVKDPYIILTRPRQAAPANQNIFTGYPSYITMTLGDCSGYTVVYEVHLEGMTATDEEKSEITRLLKEGVIL